MSRDGAEAVKAIVARADRFGAEPPRPLMRELPPADAFPVDALGSVLGAASNAINDRVQAPIAICGQSTLEAATLAAQGHADVELPTGQVKPISIFFVSVCPSGSVTVISKNQLPPIVHSNGTSATPLMRGIFSRMTGIIPAWLISPRTLSIPSETGAALRVT